MSHRQRDGEGVSYNFVDVIALVIATAALVVSAMQGSTQLKLQKAAWQPYLVIEFIKTDAEPKKGFLLRNVGTGPAKIHSFKYFKNEEDYRKGISHQEWLDANRFSRAVLLGFNFEDINYLTEGYVIPKESEDDFFLLGTTAKEFYDSSTADSMSEVIIEIEYKSVLPVDETLYYLKFCENFVSNNVTDRNKTNSYE